MTTKTQYFEYEIAHAMLEMKRRESPPTEQKARTTKLKLKDTTISTLCYDLWFIRKATDTCRNLLL